MIHKSKTAISFYEYKNKMNELIEYENEWGQYIDIDLDYDKKIYNNKLCSNNKLYNNNNNNNSYNKYEFISISSIRYLSLIFSAIKTFSINFLKFTLDLISLITSSIFTEGAQLS
jgi:hypothetical protein